METLMEFLATTGCMDDEIKDENKITLMEFLFGADNKPLLEIANIDKGMSLSESKINVKLSYIDETPVEESRELLVDILIKYMESYNEEPIKSMSVTPCLSEKSKSDVTISKIETFSDISKTKSDSTLTQTQDTVIDKELDSRRISETVVDLSNIKQDLEDIFEQAVVKVCELKNIDVQDDDTMSENEDLDNFTAYTKPPLMYNIYSVELSDILEEDENDPSCRGFQEDRMTVIRECAEDLLDFIEDRVQSHFESDSSGDEFDINPSIERSISLIDLRSIPDLPPSIIRPKVVKVDKSTSTENDSVSDNRRVDSGCMTEDTSLTTSSDKQERVLDKLESLHKFFSRSRLEIITESMEEDKNDKKPQQVKESEIKSTDLKVGQASLDDVEDLQDDFDEKVDICVANDKKIAGTGTTDEIATTDENFNENVIVEEIQPVYSNSIAIVDPDRCIVENEPLITNLRTTDSDLTDPKVTDLNITGHKITHPNLTETDPNVTDTSITSPKITDTNITDLKGTDPYITETDPNVTNLKITDSKVIGPYVTETDPRTSDRMVTDTNVTTEFMRQRQNVNAKKVCQNNDKLEDKSNERQGRNISENDFTEIDKIIAEAIQIILVNKLEEYNLK